MGGNGEETPIHMALQRILTMGCGRHMVTWLYRELIDMQCECLGATRARWERDLGSQFEDRDWAKCLDQVKKVLRNSCMKFTQLNYVHQCYLGPVKLTRMFGGPARPCPRCNSPQASFYHMV